MTEVERPHHAADAVTQEFWDGIARGELLLQRCARCERHVFYPRPVCPHCMSAELTWVRATGRGVVYSHTVVHRPPPGFDAEPYAVVLIDLEEGVRMMSQVIGTPATEVRIGDPVEVAIEGEPPRPYFRPAA